MLLNRYPKFGFEV